MRPSAGNHGLSASAKSIAVLTLAAVTFAQFLALSHEMTVRHFRCPEHGELTHVATAIDRPAVEPRRAADALGAQVCETVDAHEHCATAFTVEGASAAPVVRVPVRFTPPPVVRRSAPVVAARLGRAVILASAPKTSPPSA